MAVEGGKYHCWLPTAVRGSGGGLGVKGVEVGKDQGERAVLGVGRGLPRGEGMGMLGGGDGVMEEGK